MDTGLSFSKNELLTAAKLNELVRAVNAAGAAGDTPAAARHTVQYHQATELRMPVEPAGGFYDLRRGLASMGICASNLACATAWVGHAPGVQTLDSRTAAEEDGVVAWSLQAECGASLWQVVRTLPNGTVCANCTVYVAPGCCAPQGHPWSVRANEGGQVVRLLGKAVRSPLTYCGCNLPDSMKFEVMREHDLQLPVLTQGAPIRPAACHSAYMSMVDSSNPQTTLVYNLGLHAPEGDFTLTYDASTVTVWQNQVQPAVVGGHVYNGPGAVNGNVQLGERVWTAHKPAVAAPCAWNPGVLNVCVAETSGGDMCDMTLWLRVCTDRFGAVCSSCLVRCGDVQESPPGSQQLWNPDLCETGELWHRVGAVKNGRAVTMHDFRLPVLTQNAVASSDWVRSYGVKLMQEPDNASANRFVKRLVSCHCLIVLEDIGCAVVLRARSCCPC